MALSDDKVVSIVKSRIARSVGYMDSAISRERQDVLEYYKGERPKPMHKGNSRYISHDVFETVEMMSAQLLETFSGTLQPVYFSPQGPNDVREAKIATELVNTTVDQMNDGFQIRDDVIKDALTGRIGVAKVWWEQNEEEEELVWEAEDGAPDDSDLYAFMAQNPDAEVTDADEHPETGMVKKATFSKTTDSSQVRIMSIPGEEFGVSAGARSLADADTVYHRKEMTHSELEAMYPDQGSVIKELPTGHDWLSDGERLVRAGEIDQPVYEDDDEQNAGRKVEVFETYTKLDIDETDGANSTANRKLWKIVVAGGKLLEKERVKRIPFVAFIPLPVPHTIWGTNYAAKVIPTQNARTVLRRGILDHTVLTTNPRHTVVRGGLPNPSELTENRIGGLINITKPDAINPLMTAPLNPFVFQTIASLDDDKEELTGISKLSQGLNKDALSKQNSGEMVEQLVSMSQVRQKVIARRFAEMFLKPLYLEVYQLIIENAKKQFILEVAGDWVPVDPSALRVRKELNVDFALGYGEKQREAQKWAGIFANLQQAAQTDPALAQSFGAPQKWLLVSRALEANGVKDIEAVFPNPAGKPPPPPNPHQQAELQGAQADAQMKQAQAQASVSRIQREQQKDQMQHDLEMAKLQLEMSKIQNQLQLDVRKQAHTEALDAAVLRMDQEEMEAGNAQAVITAKT